MKLMHNFSVFVAGVIVGLLTAHYWPVDHAKHLWGAVILERRSQQEFSYQMYGQRWEMVACKDSKLDWEPGDQIEDAEYLQAVGCKHVLWFRALTDPETGNRIKASTEVANAN